MRKGYDFLGKTIVSYATGEKLDRVKDIVFDPNTNRLLALIVREKNWFNPTQIVLLQDIRAIGANAIIITSEDAVISAEQVPQVKQVLAQPHILRGTQVMTTNGHDLGRITDLYVDEETGIIEGYEVSGSSFASTHSGHSFIPAPQTLKIGQQVAFVSPEVLDLMQERVDQFAASSIQNTVPATAISPMDDAIPVKVTVDDAIVDDVVVDPATRKAFVIGKSAQWMVNAPDGTVVVMAEQEITPEVADLAEQYDVLHELYRATGGDSTSVVAEQTTALTDASRLPFAIEQTLGRRVRQVVRRPEGAIVAAPGQIVTEKVIERARYYHAEQQLRAAVGLPTREDLRTNEQFETTVNQVSERLRSGVQKAGVEARSLWERVKLAADDWRERNRQADEERRIKSALGRPVTRVILDRQDNVILNVGELVTHEAIESARRSNVLDILLDSVHSPEPHLSSADTRAPRTGQAALESHDYGGKSI